jgi:hypothetical protein
VVTASSLSYASAATPDSPDQTPRWLTQMVEPFGTRRDRPDPALLAVWLSPHRRAPRSHRCRHRGRGRGTRGHRPRDTGRPHRTVERILDITCAGTGRSPGHRTPDAWTRPSSRTGRPRHGRHQTDIPDHHDHPTARWDAEPWTCGRHLLRSANDDGSATMRYLPARDYLQHYQGLLSRSVGQAAPWRIALLR